MIRYARVEDVERLVSLGLEFFAGHQVPGEPRAHDMAASFSAWLNAASGPNKILVWVDSDGVIQGAIGWIEGPMYWNASCLASTELFWWVTPEARKSGVGKALLSAYGNEADKAGIKHVFMTTLADSSDSAKALLDRLGYVQTEAGYTRKRR